MNSKFENEFGQEEERVRGRSRRRGAVWPQIQLDAARGRDGFRGAVSAPDRRPPGRIGTGGGNRPPLCPRL